MRQTNMCDVRTYELCDVLRLGRRYRNAKRTYLLINPLQAKHLAVSPRAALELMQSLGANLLDSCEDVRCVVGFAETATAIAGAAAMCFPDDVFYVQTTREFPAGQPDTMEFLEEHSHAAEQQIYANGLQNVPQGSMLLIDDEISTGKTMRNIIRILRDAHPQFSEFYIGSVLNRMDAESRTDFAADGIFCKSLITAQEGDYEAQASRFPVQAPEKVDAEMRTDYTQLQSDLSFDDLRRGLTCGELRSRMEHFADEWAERLRDDLPRGGRILMLGTEECMLPALMLGAALEQADPDAFIRCHATTRSPIGVLDAADYPIRRGYQIPSFYAADRATYLYNPDAYDRIVIVTDSKDDRQCDLAVSALMRVFSVSSDQIILIRS